MTSCVVEDNPAGNVVEPTASLSTPLTLEAIEDGSITFLNNAANPVTYQINGGAEQIIAVTGENTGGTEIGIKAGDVVTFKATNTTYFDDSNNYQSNISCSADCYIYGNVMSLIDAKNFPTLKEFDTTNGEAAFFSLFSYNTHIKNDGKNALFLPATTLTDYCYFAMFYACTGMIEAPALPATTLADYCYYFMFNGCTNLASVSCSATDISAKDCTTDWLQGVAATGTFTTPSTTDWTSGFNGIPEGWTRVDL